MLAPLLALAMVAPQTTAPAPQDGVLVSFTEVVAGSSCSGTGKTNGTVDDSGNVSGTTTTNTNCSLNRRRHYTVTIGGSTMVLEPKATKKAKGAALATLGWSAVFAKESVLSNQLPGIHFLAWSDASGIHIKLGKRESLYEIVAAK